MMDPIKSPVFFKPDTRPAAGRNQTEAPEGGSFGDVLQRSLGEVNRLQNTADTAIGELATGKTADIHNTMIAVEKAGIAFELVMQIRNKLVSAYETVMRMQV